MTAMQSHIINSVLSSSQVKFIPSLAVWNC